MTTRIVDLLHLRRPAAEVVPVQAGPYALIGPVDERIRQLRDAFSYVHVAIDPGFEPSDCGWCDGQGTTSVRVYGDETAVPDVEGALVEEEACQACALKEHGPVWQAGYESRSDRDIRIEVCP